MDPRANTATTNTIFIGFLWFMSSSIFSTIANTSYLQRFDNGAGSLTVVRFLGSAILGLCYHGKEVKNLLSRKHLQGFAFPAVMLLLANLFNSISLASCGITVTYIVKSAIPIFTVLYARFVTHKIYSNETYAALLLTCVGVSLAAISDVQFHIGGVLAAILSTMCQVALNISSKISLTSFPKISGIQSQFIMVFIASQILAAFMLVYDNLLTSSEFSWYAVLLRELGDHNKSTPAWVLILAAALAYHFEYVLNFIFVGKVSPVVFSITDIARRLSIICCGAIFFQKSLTTLNVFGIFVSLSGVLWFSLRQKVKAD